MNTQLTAPKILFVYAGALLVAIGASCTRAQPDPNKVHPAGTTTSGLQELRSGNANGVANSAPTTEDNHGFATQPMDGSTTAVAPATANILTGTSSGTTSEPSADRSREIKPPTDGMKIHPGK